MPEWFDAEQLSTMSTAMIAGVVVVAIWLVRAVGRLVTRLAVLGIAVAIVATLWTQRTSLEQCHSTCSCSLYGQEVSVPSGAWCGS